MADILIKNMEMPKRCTGCFNSKCLLFFEHTDPNNSRHPNCPLVALPEHGDLIDRDKLYKDTEGIGDYCYDPSFGELCDALCDAPVIVEASNGYNN